MLGQFGSRGWTEPDQTRLSPALGGDGSAKDHWVFQRKATETPANQVRIMSSQKSNAHWDVQVEDVHELDVTRKTGGDLQASHLPNDGGCATFPLKDSGPRPALQLRNFRAHQPFASGIRPDAIGLRHGDAEEHGFGDPADQTTQISSTPEVKLMMEEVPGVKLCWDQSAAVGIEFVHEEAAEKGLQVQTADGDTGIRPDAIGVRQADVEECSFGVRDSDQTAQNSLGAPEVKPATEEAQGVKLRGDQRSVVDGVEVLDGPQVQTDRATESRPAPLRMVANGEMQRAVEITPLAEGSHLDIPFGASPAERPIGMSPAKKLHDLRSAKTLHQQRQNELQRCVADFVRSDELLSCIQRTEDSKALIDGLQDRPGDKDRPYVLSVALKEVQENKLLAQAEQADA